MTVYVPSVATDVVCFLLGFHDLGSKTLGFWVRTLGLGGVQVFDRRVWFGEVSLSVSQDGKGDADSGLRVKG